jgi:hypothetical protein
MRRSPLTRRFAAALTVAFGLGAGSAYAQLEVNDIAAIARNAIIAGLKGVINENLDAQQQLFVKMATRLAKFTPLSKYAILMDDTPEWRIHDWFTGANLYSNDFLQAMTYGDRSGAGYHSVSAPRVGGADAAMARLTPDAQAYLKGELALLDIADSIITRGTDQTGQLRFNGREEARTIDVLQQSVTDEDDEQSLTAVLDKISAAALMEANNKQARIQFETAMLEHLALDNMRDRNADAMQMNMILNQRQDAGTLDAGMMTGAESNLRNWRQP